MSRSRIRSTRADAACVAATDLARQAAEEIAGPGEVGAHLGFDNEGDRVVTHYFECLNRAYRGWRWAVTVARAARARHVTVSETVLLPGEGALLAPRWVPWHERLRPGDLGVGDLLPAQADDERLVPGYTSTSEELDRQSVFEFGLGRARVLSAIGRDRAAERWYSGQGGPNAPIAQAAPGQCGTCGFYWPRAGSLGQLCGVCANEYAPDDGRVVSADHGCGAHSEAELPSPVPEPAPPILDDTGFEPVDFGEDEGETEAATEPVNNS
ncbi:MAG: DUF3027 domain-containing protein [Thermobispora sp.]|nr:DUF3027 domain-containing protein [Thermobispora sp.]